MLNFKDGYVEHCIFNEETTSEILNYPSLEVETRLVHMPTLPGGVLTHCACFSLRAMEQILNEKGKSLICEHG